jgi:hypothetical protein
MDEYLCEAIHGQQLLVALDCPVVVEHLRTSLEPCAAVHRNGAPLAVFEDVN